MLLIPYWCPYSFVMMNNPEYAADFDALYELCNQRGVAMQTLKSIAAHAGKTTTLSGA
ncbi:MAG: hypothetical protein CM15mP120_16250 [Pseudomonadota bacterium]|nr:MAG: hypothetical protein CM15mP120_16250 [Pseudomonadota bacterium]